MTTKLRLAPGFTLPADAVTQTFAILAKRGSSSSHCRPVIVCARIGLSGSRRASAGWLEVVIGAYPKATDREHIDDERGAVLRMSGWRVLVAAAEEHP